MCVNSTTGVTAADLIALLQGTCTALEQGDTFEGRIAYQECEPGSFHVSAAVRIGTSMGQGGMVLVERWEAEAADMLDETPVAPVYRRLSGASCPTCGVATQRLEPGTGWDGPVFALCFGCSTITQIGSWSLSLEQSA